MPKNCVLAPLDTRCTHHAFVCIFGQGSYLKDGFEACVCHHVVDRCTVVVQRSSGTFSNTGRS